MAGVYIACINLKVCRVWNITYSFGTARIFKIVHTGGKIVTQFGRTENQIYHAFRHTDALGLDRAIVPSSIQAHFKTVSSQVMAGKSFNQIINISGQKLLQNIGKIMV